MKHSIAAQLVLFLADLSLYMPQLISLI